jgi:putative oxidoreductase
MEDSMATTAEPIFVRRPDSPTDRRVTPSYDSKAAAKAYEWTRFLVPLGRALFASIFLAAVPGHFSAAYVGYATQAGVPFANILVPFFGIVAAVGGLSILLGFHARAGAWLLIAFLIPVTFTMHAFWNVPDPALHAIQLANFMKNLALIGAALLLGYWGAGPVSVDVKNLWRA